MDAVVRSRFCNQAFLFWPARAYVFVRGEGANRRPNDDLFLVIKCFLPCIPTRGGPTTPIAPSTCFVSLWSTDLWHHIRLQSCCFVFARSTKMEADAIWFLHYFNPQANGVMYLECRECWEGIYPAFQANFKTKQRSFSIILTINIMQQRGMSWRVLRSFKTSVVNVLRLLRPLI